MREISPASTAEATISANFRELAPGISPAPETSRILRQSL
jgi:hypothetical protein